MVFSTRSGKPYRKILPGMHFGEIAILKDVRLDDSEGIEN